MTTGSITVPFIMALGIGMASVRSDKNSGSDSFGLISLCSIGPVLSVLLFGIWYRPEEVAYTAAEIVEIVTTRDAAKQFSAGLPAYLEEVALAVVPIAGLFLLPLAMGACEAVGGNILADAFGVAAMVAMTPLLTIQVFGMSSQIRRYLEKRKAAGELENAVSVWDLEDCIVYFGRETYED